MWQHCRNMPSSQLPIFTYNSRSWMVYDWASSVLPTLHTTFVFAVYFTIILSPDNGNTTSYRHMYLLAPVSRPFGLTRLVKTYKRTARILRFAAPPQNGLPVRKPQPRHS